MKTKLQCVALVLFVTVASAQAGGFWKPKKVEIVGGPVPVFVQNQGVAPQPVIVVNITNNVVVPPSAVLPVQTPNVALVSPTVAPTALPSSPQVSGLLVHSAPLPPPPAPPTPAPTYSLDNSLPREGFLVITNVPAGGIFFLPNGSVWTDLPGGGGVIHSTNLWVNTNGMPVLIQHR